ncbi:MAG: RHS domain-containing protein [Kangiellaceae bacterium]|nr:RHS domain-containing protein [Kangiellaceae bacterium]MCW8999156.1 RHS domain-containing protein [Kangiellaceae bacterium]MCW9015626.1 RHS domain-containing protein [Kangiellaceae bacterium]
MNVRKICNLLIGSFLLLSIGVSQAAEMVTYYVNDALGSPVAAMDKNGALLWRESYNPYGETRLNPSANQNDVGYTGHQKDSTTGLTYMQARYYDPLIGRFYSDDPVGFVQENAVSFNRYAYANNNPYKYTDPNGEFAWLAYPIVKWGAAAIATACTASEACRDAVTSAVDGVTDVLADGMQTVGNALSEQINGDDKPEAEPEPGTPESDYGCVYECDGTSEGQETESGKPYVGTSNDKEQRAKTARDGRNRENAPKIGKYPKGDRDARRKAEQEAMNERGGVDNLDNKRNEVKEKDWEKKGIKPPQEQKKNGN